MATGSLYFHSPCFDGIVSAVLSAELLERVHDWLPLEPRAVNYEVREQWLARTLGESTAIVDFLYHPQAKFWADHHGTAFLNETLRAEFAVRRDPFLIYDAAASSCAILLWRRFGPDLRRAGRDFDELVRWADKIDAARYDSVEEAMVSTDPALRITLALSLGDAGDLPERLVSALRTAPLEQVAAWPEIHKRFERGRDLRERGLERFKRAASLAADGIVVFDVDAADTLVSRYAPFFFFPEARYSAGIVRGASGAKITAMRNPWREFTPAPLGHIASTLGGGGHQRVGSIALSRERASTAVDLLERLLAQIRAFEQDRAQRAR
ncbi:MAG: hypothetical protein DMD78_02400 [Candidatus Rokuibacteriota bacterium]|nr:MAG: hypothetical protein DMD78_02400 [Candidatus Rokubacteria bacterium]